MNKKLILITSIITAIVVFLITTLFYLSYIGSVTFLGIYDKVNDTSLVNYVVTEHLVEENFIGDYSKAAAWYTAMHSYVDSLGDEYSSYLSASEYEGLNSNLSGSYQGIGITVNEKDGKIYIKDVKESYPADKAGIMPGDYLYKVDGQMYDASSLSTAISRIKSVKVGETIKITVLRNGEEMEFDIKIENIEIDYVTGEMLEDSVGYIRIESFGRGVEEDFGSLLKELSGMKALIIDVRSNPGGTLDSAVEVADQILDSGKILTVRNKSGEEVVYEARKGSVDVPVCVLIDENSASSSEILAGALKDNGKAILVGQKTYGKGVVQSIYSLANGEALRITTAKYYTPSGECIDGVGIYPDIEVTLPEGVTFDLLENSPDDDTQLMAAIEALRAME